MLLNYEPCDFETLSFFTRIQFYRCRVVKLSCILTPVYRYYETRVLFAGLDGSLRGFSTSVLIQNLIVVWFVLAQNASDFFFFYKQFKCKKSGKAASHNGGHLASQVCPRGRHVSEREPGLPPPLKFNLAQGQCPKFKMYLFVLNIKNVLGL